MKKNGHASANGHPDDPATTASPRSTAAKKIGHTSAKKYMNSHTNGAATDLHI